MPRLRHITACDAHAAKEAARRHDAKAREAYRQYRFDLERARMNAPIRSEGEPSIAQAVSVILFTLAVCVMLAVAFGG